MTYDIILQECFNLVKQLKKRDSWDALENNEFKVGGVTNQGPWSNKDISIIGRLYLPGDLGIVCILFFCLHLCPFAVMPSEQVWAGRSSGRWDSGVSHWPRVRKWLQALMGSTLSVKRSEHRWQKFIWEFHIWANFIFVWLFSIQFLSHFEKFVLFLFFVFSESILALEIRLSDQEYKTTLIDYTPPPDHLIMTALLLYNYISSWPSSWSGFSWC